VQAGKSIELVFISSDKNEAQFNAYHAQMPFFALPYGDRDRKNKLSKKYKVSGIPTLVLLNSTTNIITNDGRSAIMDINKFPWKPLTTTEIIGPEFLKGNDGDKVSLTSLSSSGSFIGIYFSAQWCQPCRGFTPKLIEVYNKVRQAGKVFEIIFASLDKDEDTFNEYFEDMPWIAIPFSDRKRKDEMSSKFNVKGIPRLIILDSNLNVVNSDAAGDVGSDSQGGRFPWLPKKVYELEEKTQELNDVPSIVVLMEEAGDKWDAVEASLDVVASEVFGKLESGLDREFAFFVRKGTGDVSQQLRRMTMLSTPGSKPEMILLDLPNSGSFYTYEGDVTEENIRNFILDYWANKLRKQTVNP